MSDKLEGLDIDPTKLTLMELKKHGLAKGKALEAIKNVSETAFKENSIVRPAMPAKSLLKKTCK